VIPASLLEAAETGVQAEINNIAMYEKFLTYSLPQDCGGCIRCPDDFLGKPLFRL
jgi:hypothetical protein